MRIVTTSWDDGDRSDLRIADMLLARAISGTFYVAVNGVTRSPLLATELRSLSSEGFEIGAHTTSHPNLARLCPDELTREVADCKDILEQVVGNRVSMFCYPGGRYNRKVMRELQRAGYDGARTTRMFSTDLKFSPFEMPTTIQAYSHTLGQQLRNILRSPSIHRFGTYVTELHRCRDWVKLGQVLFDRVLNRGGVWHLYGHSWELDALGLWDDLREMLDYVHGREGVTYLTNGEIMRLLQGGHKTHANQPVGR
jgi:peptidoglycan-N-acetylglucosamine deacetylase